MTDDVEIVPVLGDVVSADPFRVTRSSRLGTWEEAEEAAGVSD
jgi:hypothetical protein